MAAFNQSGQHVGVQINVGSIEHEWALRYRDTNKFLKRKDDSFGWMDGPDDATKFDNRYAALQVATDLHIRDVAVPVKLS